MLLLDTHVFLWWRTNDARLAADARDAIATTDIVFISAASAWEAAIKIALGRLTLPEPFAHGVDDRRLTLVSHDRALEPYGVPMLWT